MRTFDCDFKAKISGSRMSPSAEPCDPNSQSLEDAAKAASAQPGPGSLITEVRIRDDIEAARVGVWWRYLVMAGHGDGIVRG